MENENLKKIERIVRLSYISNFLQDEKPLSIILVAPPEQSKTHYLLKYNTRYSHKATDLSYKGLIDILINDKKAKQIVIPDFLKLTEKNQSTKKSLISALNSFLEEGIFSINLANKEEINLKGRRGAIITSTTKESFKQNNKNWAAMGFKSRFLPVSWEFSQETLNKLMKDISKEKNSNPIKPIKLNYKKTPIEFNTSLGDDLIKLAEGSPRRFKNLKVLLKAISLENGRKKTTKEDFNQLKELNYFINLKFNKI